MYLYLYLCCICICICSVYSYLYFYLHCSHRTECGIPLCTGVPRYVLRLLSHLDLSGFLFTIWTNTIHNVDKYILIFGQIHVLQFLAIQYVLRLLSHLDLSGFLFIMWTNTFYYSDKLIFRCTICTLEFYLATFRSCCPTSTQMNFSPLCANNL